MKSLLPVRPGLVSDRFPVVLHVDISSSRVIPFFIWRYRQGSIMPQAGGCPATDGGNPRRRSALWYEHRKLNNYLMIQISLSKQDLLQILLLVVNINYQQCMLHHKSITQTRITAIFQQEIQKLNELKGLSAEMQQLSPRSNGSGGERSPLANAAQPSRQIGVGGVSHLRGALSTINQRTKANQKFAESMEKQFDNLPQLQIIHKREVLPEEQNSISSMRFKGYAQFPTPLRGSSFHKSQRGDKEIKNLTNLRETTESKMRAYLSERKSEFHNRGTITNMPRDANPSYLFYSHVKIKPQKKITSYNISPNKSILDGSLSPDQRGSPRSIERDDWSSPIKSTLVNSRMLDFRTLDKIKIASNKPQPTDLRNQILSNVASKSALETNIPTQQDDPFFQDTQSVQFEQQHQNTIRLPRQLGGSNYGSRVSLFTQNKNEASVVNLLKPLGPPLRQQNVEDIHALRNRDQEINYDDFDMRNYQKLNSLQFSSD